MIRYGYNIQKQPPAPFVRVTLCHPRTGSEVRDLPAQLDTGADQTLVPSSIVEQLGLDFSGSVEVVGISGISDEVELYTVSLGIHTLALQTLEVLAHPDEPWVLVGRDVLNRHRLVFDGPKLVLEIS